MAAVMYAEKSVEKSSFLALEKEIQRLKETEKMLRVKESCCQKAKEMLLKQTRESHLKNDGLKFILPNECNESQEFLEIHDLLWEIKKSKRKHLMLEHQLHQENIKQEIATLDNMLYKQSKIILDAGITDADKKDKLSPLAFWLSEMVNTMQKQNMENKKQSGKVKLSEMNQLFYNIHYKDGSKGPCDLLAESIFTKKIKQGTKTLDPVETLQFSTCYKGFCVQIKIIKSTHDKRNQDETILETNYEPFRYYQCYSDIQLEQIREQLLDSLLKRNEPGEFVRKHVWTELEKLITPSLKTKS